MTRLRTGWLVLAIGAIALVAVACSGAGASGPESGGDRPGVSQPGGQTGDPLIDPNPDTPVDSSSGDGGALPPDSDGGDPVRAPELAPIEEIEVIVRESYPPQYVIEIVSGLPSGCASHDRTEVTRDGNTITVEIWNSVIVDPAYACTMIYGLHRESVDLGSDFVSGQEYTVHVNDQTVMFVAQ